MKEDNEDTPVEMEELPPALGLESARKLRLARVLPLHDATGDFSRKRAGSPTKVVDRNGQRVSMPTVDDLQYHARMQEEQLRFVEQDELVQAATNKASSPEVIRLTLIRVARNAALLEFQRIEQEKRGKDTTQLVSRSTNVLKEIAALEEQLRTLGEQIIDPTSEAFQRLFRLWGEIIKGVVDEVLTPEQKDMFWTKFTTEMETWEERAEEVLR
jgi:hypothetical protein